MSKGTKYYPYLALPWKFKDPIVDYDVYHNAFHVPEVICQNIHHLDYVSTSVDELNLEKKLLEERINELRNAKLVK
jgi:hypothetical protein